jgi:DNA-binding SARP family transcriptional activator
VPTVKLRATSAVEPLSEAFHARAMRIYAAQDRRDAVVAQYREAANRWDAEGFDSPEELRVLAGQLLGKTSRRGPTPGIK